MEISRRSTVKMSKVDLRNRNKVRRGFRLLIWNFLRIFMKIRRIVL